MNAKAVILAPVACLALWHAVSLQAQVTNPPYLSQMPTVEGVMRDVKGVDPIDTTARQAGVLWQLQGVILNLARGQGRNDFQLAPAESRLSSEYRTAYYSVW